MSMESYIENVRLGVTGPNTNTCFTAASEMLCNPPLSPSTHITYEGYVAIENNLKIRHRPKIMSAVFDLIAVDFGLNSHTDIGYESVNTANELKLLLRKLFKNGNPVVVDIDSKDNVENFEFYNPEIYAHSLGLIPVSIKPEAFTFIGTWLPSSVLEGIVYTSEDLFDLIQQYNDKPIKKWPFYNANISYFPNEISSLR